MLYYPNRYPTQELMEELVQMLKSSTVRSNNQLFTASMIQMSNLFYQAYVNPTTMKNNFPSMIFGIFGTKDSRVLTEEFIPFIIEQIERSESEHVILSAIIALGKTGHLKGLKALAKEIERASLDTSSVHNARKSPTPNCDYLCAICVLGCEDIRRLCHCDNIDGDDLSQTPSGIGSANARSTVPVDCSELCSTGDGGAICDCGDMPPYLTQAPSASSSSNEGSPIDCTELCRKHQGGALCDCGDMPPALSQMPSTKVATNEMRRTLATYALKRLAKMNPSEIRPILMSIILNSVESADVRTAGIAVLPFSQPTIAELQQLAIRTWIEPSEHVASFIISTLRSLAFTQAPELKTVALKAR